MGCTTAEPQKKIPVMKQFTLCFQNVAQNDALDRLWFGAVWFPVHKSECDGRYAQTQNNIVDPCDFDVEPGHAEHEPCFSRSQVRDPTYLLRDSGATHVLLLVSQRSKGIGDHDQLGRGQRKGEMLVR